MEAFNALFKEGSERDVGQEMPRIAVTTRSLAQMLCRPMKRKPGRNEPLRRRGFRARSTWKTESALFAEGSEREGGKKWRAPHSQHIRLLKSFIFLWNGNQEGVNPEGATVSGPGQYGSLKCFVLKVRNRRGARSAVHRTRSTFAFCFLMKRRQGRREPCRRWGLRARSIWKPYMLCFKKVWSGSGARSAVHRTHSTFAQMFCFPMKRKPRRSEPCRRRGFRARSVCNHETMKLWKLWKLWNCKNHETVEYGKTT